MRFHVTVRPTLPSFSVAPTTATRRENRAQRLPLIGQDVGEPKEMAYLVAFLVSSRSSYIVRSVL